ncbi:MAG: redoxin family protein [Deltaproteobacteria bacterium]|nr:redoxin family protein [Deltaproteobacteria bacterium]
MKRIIVAVFLILFCGAFLSHAAELKVGDKLPDFKLNDALDNKAYSLSSPEFAGRSVYIVYASTSSSDDNDHVTNALNANKDVMRLKSENKYVGLGIGNQKDSPVPNFVIKSVAKRKQKSSGAIILLDPDFTVGKALGLASPHKAAVSFLVDKNRIVRYIYSGKTPAENIPKIVDLIKKYSE